jgi:UDP-N-acetylglucosamine 4,6-dehydratase
MKIIDLAQAIAPDCEIEFIGIRPGEKLHEMLITEEEGRNTVAFNGMYIIMPNLYWWKRQNYKNGRKLPDGFVYSSKTNEKWLNAKDLKEIIQRSLPAEKDPFSHFISLVHSLKEKFVLNMINSEENIPERGVQ